MHRGHRIAISAIAATAITAGGGAALVAGPHTQAAKAVGRPAPVTSAGALAEFAWLKADVLSNQGQLDVMTRAILLAQARIQAHAKRQAALALRRAAADAAHSAAAAAHTAAARTAQAAEAAEAAEAAQASRPARTTPVLHRAPVTTRGGDTATPAGAPPAPVSPSTTPGADPTTSPPGDDEGGHGGHDGGRGGHA